MTVPSMITGVDRDLSERTFAEIPYSSIFFSFGRLQNVFSTDLPEASTASFLSVATTKR